MIWNNKGGVGKTFLTYLLASEYAVEHKDTTVVVVDLCPQANVSEILLGGNGKGEENLSELQSNGTTIAGYIKERFNKSFGGKLGNEVGYFVKVMECNKAMPDNLYLLPGDVDLDICRQLIEYMGNAPIQNAWQKSRMLLHDLTESFERDHKKSVFFVDCNPSFASYTELAVASSERIIVPCTADYASIRGIYNLFRMIYGIRSPQSMKVTEQDVVLNTFIEKSVSAKFQLPKIHLFIQNKSRSADKKAAKAFEAHVTKIREVAGEIEKEYPDYFSQNRQLVANVKDGNTLAAIINYEGELLRNLQPGPHQVYDHKTQANSEQIEALQKDIKDCIGLI
jgi:cellulose biosynthesis protein BcsQ